MLDVALFSIGQLHLGLFTTHADTRILSTGITRFFEAHTWSLTTLRVRFRWCCLTDARIGVALGARFRFLRWTIPLVVLKMLIGFHKIIDCEEVLPIEKQPPLPATFFREPLQPQLFPIASMSRRIYRVVNSSHERASSKKSFSG